MLSSFLLVIFIHPTPWEDLDRDFPKQKESICSYGEEAFVVKQISFQGNFRISQEELQKITKSFLQKPCSQDQLDEIKNQVLFLYQTEGVPQVIIEAIADQKNQQVTIWIKEESFFLF